MSANTAKPNNTFSLSSALARYMGLTEGEAAMLNAPVQDVAAIAPVTVPQKLTLLTSPGFALNGIDAKDDPTAGINGSQSKAKRKRGTLLSTFGE